MPFEPSEFRECLLIPKGTIADARYHWLGDLIMFKVKK
jgi:hypothetical protein